MDPRFARCARVLPFLATLALILSVLTGAAVWTKTTNAQTSTLSLVYIDSLDPEPASSG